jgi:hypothetical protein
MGTLSVRLPESIHNKIREMAEKEGVSINQLVNSAVAEKLSAIMTEEYLEERARQGSREQYENVLSKVADREPEDYDKE